MPNIYSVGHGTRPIEEFVDVLRAADVKRLADIRSAPRSRRHPQFGQAALGASLTDAGIEYVHLAGLGGRRDAAPDSPHVALKVDAFRGYADHMSTDEFGADYARVVRVARERTTAFICAETLWRCHRRMLSDRLTVDGWDVARVVDGRLVYDDGAIPLGS